MAPLLYTQTSHIGVTTIASSWTLAVIALLAVAIETRHRFERKVRLGIDGFSLILATTISIILTAQTTWAIVDEGQGEHTEFETSNEIALIAKVYPLYLKPNDP